MAKASVLVFFQHPPQKDALPPLHSLVFIAEAPKNKQSDRRGQIALFARAVDLRDQFRQRHLLGMRNFLQVSPEGIFKADAGLVPINYDGTLNDRGFH